MASDQIHLAVNKALGEEASGVRPAEAGEMASSARLKGSAVRENLTLMRQFSVRVDRRFLGDVRPPTGYLALELSAEVSREQHADPATLTNVGSRTDFTCALMSLT